MLTGSCSGLCVRRGDDGAADGISQPNEGTAAHLMSYSVSPVFSSVAVRGAAGGAESGSSRASVCISVYVGWCVCVTICVVWCDVARVA